MDNWYYDRKKAATLALRKQINDGKNWLNAYAPKS